MKSWRSAERRDASNRLRRRLKWETRPRRQRIKNRTHRLIAQLLNIESVLRLLKGRLFK